MIETRNPAARAWESWTPGRTRTVAESSVYGPIETHYDALAPDRGGIVAIAEYNRLLRTGEERIRRRSIRFIEQDHLKELTAHAGLAPIAWYGDWDRGPLLPDSKEIIVVTQRSGT